MTAGNKGKNVAWLSQISKDGTKVKAIDEMPEVGQHCGWLWSAYNALGARRGAGPDGPLPITFSDIMAYATFYGFDSVSQRRILAAVVTELDDVYLDHVQEARKKAQEKQKSGSKRSRRRR